MKRYIAIILSILMTSNFVQAANKPGQPEIDPAPVKKVTFKEEPEVLGFKTEEFPEATFGQATAEQQRKLEDILIKLAQRQLLAEEKTTLQKIANDISLADEEKEILIGMDKVLSGDERNFLHTYIARKAESEYAKNIRLLAENAYKKPLSQFERQEVREAIYKLALGTVSWADILKQHPEWSISAVEFEAIQQKNIPALLAIAKYYLSATAGKGLAALMQPKIETKTVKSVYGTASTRVKELIDIVAHNLMATGDMPIFSTTLLGDQLGQQLKKLLERSLITAFNMHGEKVVCPYYIYLTVPGWIRTSRLQIPMPAYEIEEWPLEQLLRLWHIRNLECSVLKIIVSYIDEIKKTIPLGKSVGKKMIELTSSQDLITPLKSKLVEAEDFLKILKNLPNIDWEYTQHMIAMLNNIKQFLSLIINYKSFEIRLDRWDNSQFNVFTQTYKLNLTAPVKRTGK